MNPKTTWYLSGTAILLFAFILFSERHSLDTATRAVMAARLLPEIESARVSSIEIIQTNGLKVKLERSGNEWNLSEPFYPAQGNTIEAFLQLIEKLPRYSYITPAEMKLQSGARATLGLAPPRAEIILRQGTNRVAFSVGSRTLIGEQVYVQRSGDAGVAVTDAAILNWLPESTTQWRNPMLLPQERLAFDQLWINRDGANVLAVQRNETNQLWNLVRPLRGAPADSRLVTYLIQQLRTSRVAEFVLDDPKADVERFGLENPKLELLLAQGTNVIFQIQFGNAVTNNSDHLYARIVNYSNIVVIPKTLPDLLRLPHDEFRDRTLVTFNPAAVDRIEMLGREPFAVQRHTNQLWKIEQPFVAAAESGAVQRFLEDLSRLEIAEFYQDVETDFSRYGLVPPVREYLLKSISTNSAGNTNRVLAHIQFGSGAPSATNASLIDRVFVRRAGENSVYTITLADAARLPQAAFELRERRIWDFAGTNVTAFTVIQHGRTNRFVRQPTRLWSPDPVANHALEETLLRLGQLEAVYWVARGDEQTSRFGFQEKPFRIRLDVTEPDGPKTYSLEFGKLALSGHRYAAVTLQNEKLIFKFPIPLFSLVEQHLTIAAE